MRSLLWEDRTDEKVWISPEDVFDPELEERGQKIGVLEVEIQEIEKEIIKLEDQLHQLEITPLTEKLKSKLEKIRSLVREESFTTLKNLVGKGEL